MNVPIRHLPADATLPRVPASGLAPSLEQKRLRLYLMQVVADVLLLVGATYLAGFVYLGGTPPRLPFLAAQLLLPLYLTIALHNGTYSLDSLIDWRGASGRMAMAILIASALLNFLAFFAKFNAAFSRVVFVTGVMSAMVLMVGVRFATARWARRTWGPSAMNVLQIDAGGPPLHLPHAYRVDADEHGLRPVLDDPHMLDRLSRYLRNMDQVIVNCPVDLRTAWARVLKGAGVHGEVTSGVVREIGALGVVHREDVSTILVSTGRLGIRSRALKRVFDMALSSVALVLMSPVLVASAVLIKLEDGGPILFRQRRLGQGNRFFPIYKLRTMKAEGADGDGNRSTARDDDRITRIGRLLRRTSIDELPQLLNVLKGDMSLVGPRPHALGSQAGDKLFWQVDDRYWQRHTLRPGITGLAQIRGFRGATETEMDLSSRLQADLEYLAGWSIWRDVKILLATVRVVIHERAF